ncbi:MAG: hypothetical protein NT069_08195, partial [Planctomycetota bacterium]|nr:hypothetical protein [Planctomycetota bacterium]
SRARQEAEIGYRFLMGAALCQHLVFGHVANGRVDCDLSDGQREGTMRTRIKKAGWRLEE